MFVRNTTQLNILYSETLDALIFFYYEAADEGPRSILTLLLGNLKVSCCPLLCCLVKVVATEVGERSHDATNQTLLYSSHLNHWQRCTRKQKKKKNLLCTNLFRMQRTRFGDTEDYLSTPWKTCQLGVLKGISRKQSVRWGIKVRCPRSIRGILNPSDPVKTNTKGKNRCQKDVHSDRPLCS